MTTTQQAGTVRHWLSISSTLTSLLVATASALLWARGYWRFDNMSYRWSWTDTCDHLSYVTLISSAGSMSFSVSRLHGDFGDDSRAWETEHTASFCRYSDPAGIHSPLDPLRTYWFGYEHRATRHGADPDDPPELRRRLGLMLGTITWVDVPYWAMLLAASALPTRWLLTKRRHRRLARLAAEGRCLRCGYDLRATPDRCPECGTVVTPPPAPPPRTP